VRREAAFASGFADSAVDPVGERQELPPANGLNDFIDSFPWLEEDP
jgi:hypothetical protein